MMTIAERLEHLQSKAAAKIEKRMAAKAARAVKPLKKPRKPRKPAKPSKRIAIAATTPAPRERRPGIRLKVAVVPTAIKHQSSLPAFADRHEERVYLRNMLAEAARNTAAMQTKAESA